MSVEKPTAAGIRAAADLVRPYGAPTPLVSAPLLCDRFGCDVLVKNETVSPVASFKWRGALTAILRAGGADEVVTSSTGNHGQGVAWAARATGGRAHVFLPAGANPVKRRKIELLGATLHEHEGDLDAVKELAIAFARDRNLLFIDDGESLDVIEGAGTVGLELADAVEKADLVFVPMGSGSLASGVAIAVKDKFPNATVIAVQSSGAPAMVESFRSRRPVELPAVTIADGLICRVPAALSLQALIEHVDEAVTVADEAILAAARDMATLGHILVEPSGGAALAAAAARRDLAGKTIVLVATGSNITGPDLRRAFCGS